MNFNIKDRTILLSLIGSRAYGTNNEDSDWDYKGIAIAPIEYYLGNNSNFEQFKGNLIDNGWPGIPVNHESEIYDIKKYFQLATVSNPNILEILYAENTNRRWNSGDVLAANRDIFLSKACRHSYAGYAHAQLKKIRSHRQWLMGQVPDMPTRAQFGLPIQPPINHQQLKAAMSMVDKQIEQWTLHPEKEIPITVLTKARESIYDLIGWVVTWQDAHTTIIKTASYKLGFDTNFSEYIVKQKQYNSALDHYNSYQDWLKDRNPKRRELEKKSGYDTKHAMHLVRLLRTAEELLTTGKLLVKRPDAEELKSIRNGGWTFDQIEEYSSLMDNKLTELYNNPNCPLPYSPDKIKIDNLLVQIIREFNNV